VPVVCSTIVIIVSYRGQSIRDVNRDLNKGTIEGYKDVWKLDEFDGSLVLSQQYMYFLLLSTRVHCTHTP